MCGIVQISWVIHTQASHRYFWCSFLHIFCTYIIVYKFLFCCNSGYNLTEFGNECLGTECILFLFPHIASLIPNRNLNRLFCHCRNLTKQLSLVFILSHLLSSASHQLSLSYHWFPGIFPMPHPPEWPQSLFWSPATTELPSVETFIRV